MARLNEILVGRFNRSLQKVFGIKGGPPVATLAPEIMPVHVVKAGVEQRFLESWNKFGAGRAIAAQAANTNSFQLRNPTGSNVECVIEQIIVGSTTLQQWQITLLTASTDLATTISSISEDIRYGNQFAGVGVASFTISNTSVGSIIGHLVSGNGQSAHLIETEDQEIPIGPGQSILVQSIVQNLQTFFTLRWRERFLEESERT